MTNKVSKALRNKIDYQKKNFVYNSHHSFTKFKDINEIKELSLNSMYKTLENCNKKFTDLKNVVPRTKNKENLKEKVLEDVGDLFNDLYYIYKDKCNKEKNNLNTKDKKNLDYKKIRLTNDYEYPSKKEQAETNKKLQKLA